MTDTTTKPQPARVHYHDDFTTVIHLIDGKGNIVPFPECDWDATFRTGNINKTYRISRRGGVYTNCRPDFRGGIRVIFNSHGMGPGVLRWHPHFEFPNDMYPDGFQDICTEQALDIILVSGPGDLPADFDVKVLLPSYVYINGEADVCASALEKLNKVLAGILDGSGRYEPSARAQTSFSTSRWLMPGAMRNTARPGNVYRLHAKLDGRGLPSCCFNDNRAYVLLGITGAKSVTGTLDLSKLFPGGRFYQHEIEVVARNGLRLSASGGVWTTDGGVVVEYDRETGIVSYDFSACGECPKFPMAVVFEHSDALAQVMINAEGRLVYAPERLTPAPAPDFEFDRFEINSGREPTPGPTVDLLPIRAFAQDGRCLEVKKWKGRKINGSNCVRQWRHIYNETGTTRQILYKFRYKSDRGHRTPWKILLMPKSGRLPDSCRSTIVRALT